MLIRKISAAAIAAFTLVAAGSHADDTELYVFESSARAGARPQVLIIFDNSGSMRTEETLAKASYDPNKAYASLDEPPGYPTLYFTKGTDSSTPKPDSGSKTRRVKAELNACEASWNALNTYGFFTGFFRYYKANKLSWKIPSDDIKENKIGYFDCFEDIEQGNWRNAKGQPNGFPVDNLGSRNNLKPYIEASDKSSSADFNDALEQARQTDFGTGKALTVYTDNYLRWYHGTSKTEKQTRIQIAKDVIRNTIVTTPGVDFGLAVFNYNHPDENVQDGGRIVSAIQQMDESNKVSLINTVDNLSPQTNTPLCETLYEAKRYFAGESVYYGNKNSRGLTPGKDPAAESNGNYISPFKECQNQAFIVYITDGAPTKDQAANDEVKALPGVRTTPYKWDGKSNYLPNLAEWMYLNDLNAKQPDSQTVKTYTIGFSEGADDAAPLLKETAKVGGGQYYAARDASQLQAALQQVFSQILEVNASFTSPSIASNNFDRTQTFDAVYYAMFLPNKGPRWMGNLKKFKVTGSGDIVDKNGRAAIGTDGNLSSGACSYWTSNAVCGASSDGGDGNDVTIGGAAEVMRKAGSRTLYGDFGGSGALSTFSKANAATVAGSTIELANYMGTSENQLADLFDWAKGKDVDDEDEDNSTSDTRQDILGDPLHSKPLAINFGTPGNPDVRIMMGTNHGFMHMFKDTGDAVEESWAFMPYELLPNLEELRANVQTGVHSVYGLDSPPVAYVKTGASGVQKAWAFFGMRRGGKSYYAMDITNPDNPSLMWHLSADSAGMSELAQTWSEPVITTIPGWPAGNTDPDNARPVLIFGAGYSPATKDSGSVGSADSEGRGVFIVDAETGKLVHSFAPSGGGSTTAMPGLTDSIPNAVAILDSNSDRMTDRIYATDTGANVWRIDLPSANPNDSERPWSAFKFADLGGNTQITDRRFFSEPVVAQTMISNVTEIEIDLPSGGTTKRITRQNIPYDAIVIGSGHRPHPSDKIRQDTFFTLQDRNVTSRSFGTSDNPIPEPLRMNDLYNVTSAAPDSNADKVNFGHKRGWYYNFGATGEKSLSAASIILGKVYFTSYVPGDTSSSNTCLVAGQGRLYGMDLHWGARNYTREYLDIGQRVPDTPQLVIPPSSHTGSGENGDGSGNASNDSYMYLIGIGKAASQMETFSLNKGCADGDHKCVGGGMRANRIYYYVE